MSGLYLPAGLQDGELRPAVDLQVGVRILHRVHVAGLPGQVEEIVLALHQVVHAVRVAHIGDVDPHPVLDAGDVEQVAAVFRDQAVHQGDLRPELDQPPGQVRVEYRRRPISVLGS